MWSSAKGTTSELDKPFPPCGLSGDITLEDARGIALAAILWLYFWFFGSCDPCEAKLVAAQCKLLDASFVEFSDSGWGYTCCIGANDAEVSIRSRQSGSLNAHLE